MPTIPAALRTMTECGRSEMAELLASLGLCGPELDEALELFDRHVIAREKHILRGFARTLDDIAGGAIESLDDVRRAARRALTAAGFIQ